MAVDPKRAKTLFLAAAELAAPAERAAFLDRECGAEVELRRRVEALLAADALPVQALRAGAAADRTLDDAAGPIRPLPPHGTVPDAAGLILAGKYRLLERIGEGGMGSVWLAQQSEPVKRKVAVKVIKLGMDSRQVLTRFEAERQALAMMDHPNIAKVLDGGLAPDGRPFFVMELVKGIPITEYCDARKLSLKDRLELFVPVCQAIQHAHQKGIIHRDIKPTNVMIAMYDDRPVPKVIDFGVAKATGQSLSEATLNTGFGGVIGTPQYMSPEQATLNNLDIDTRSDVYSLGVLLYELLTGEPPFSKRELEQKGLMEVLRVVRKDEPPKPSTKLSVAASLPTLSANRSVEPKRLTRMLRSELDWIVLKALEKDRARRYETANGFAADVQRYLTGEAVIAHPPTAGYRLRKILHRHQGPALAACAVAGVLVLGIIGTTLGLFEARRQQGIAVLAQAAESEQRKRADKQREAAEQASAAERAARQLSDRRLKQVEKANDILGSIFQDLDPNVVASQQRPLQAILVERLDRAVEQIEGDSIGDPKVVATMQRRFGRSLIGLGEPRKALVLLEKARATDEALSGPNDPATLDDINDLALAHEGDGHAELAVPLLEEAMKRWKARGGPPDEATIGSIGNLAQIYLTVGKREQGLPLLEEALRLSSATLGPEHIGTITTKSNLAMAYQRADDAERAVPLFMEVATAAKDKFGPMHPTTLASLDNLAGAYLAVGKTDLAIAIYEEAFKREKAALGLDHLDTLSSMNNLASAYRSAGRLDEALPLQEEALGLVKKKLGSGHPRTIACMNSMARTYLAAKKPALAVPLLEEALKLEKASWNPDESEMLGTMFQLAIAYRDVDQRDQSVPLLEEVLRRQTARLGADHRETISVMGVLAGSYYHEKRFDKSIPLYKDQLKRLERTVGSAHEDTIFTRAYLGQNYKEAGRIAEALPLLEETHRAVGKYPELRRFIFTLQEIYTMQGKTEAAYAIQQEMLAEARKEDAKNILLGAGELASRGWVLLQKKSYAEAEPILRECLAIRQKAQPNEWTTFNTRSMLGEALLGQQKYPEAERLLLEGYEGMKKEEASIPEQAKSRMVMAMDRLVHFYEATQRPGEIKKWKAERAKYRAATTQAVREHAV